jgi:hypothetical protein
LETMRKIVKYGTLVGRTDDEIVTAVNQAIAIGWEPIGGLTWLPSMIWQGQASPGFVQSIVKYEECNVIV